MSTESNDFSKCPEMDYFMNESVSDVVFIVEGQRIPAEKRFLSIRNKVFRAMFSDNFKEYKDKEVVIKDTTFDAFKTLIQFFYSEKLVLKDSTDLKLMEEVYKLADRFEALRLLDKMAKHLKTIAIDLDNIELMSRIANSSQNKGLNQNVMKFIDKNLKEIKDKNKLIAINDFTNNQLLNVLADNYIKHRGEMAKLKFRKCNICNIIEIIHADINPKINLFFCNYCKQNSLIFYSPK